MRLKKCDLNTKTVFLPLFVCTFFRHQNTKCGTTESSPSAAADPTGGMAMSKTHSKTAKALSVFLCALMVLSTVCFFNPFPALKANATVDVTPTVTPSPSYDMTVNIPESIYLKPGSANFQYFLTNTKSGNTANANSTAVSSMSVYVSCPYASNISLSYEFDYSKTKTVTSEDGTQSAKATSGLALNVGGSTLMAKSASGTSLSFKLGTSDSLVGWTAEMDGTEYFIKWTLSYNVGGQLYTTYYYTTVYVPYLGQAGMSAHARHSGTYANPENWTYSFITGGHSVTGGAASSKFLSNKAVNTNAKGASDAVFVAPLVSFSGNNAGAKRGDVAYPFANGGTIPWGSNFYTDAFNAKANGGVALKTQTDGETNYNPYADSDLGSMKITVDASRFVNYNQIPNLSAGWAQFRHDWDGGASRLMWISGVNGTSASGVSESGLTGAAITTNADTSKYEGYVSLAKGLYALNGAVTAGDHLMVFGYRNAYSPYVGNDSITRTFAGVKLNVTKTDKSALRSALFNVYIHGYAGEMAGSYGTALRTAVNNASAVLADQFATAAEITSATNAVNAALSDAAIEAFTNAIQGNRETADIFVAVPETIYLTPAASNMTKFQCFANNILNEDGTVTAETGTSATGKFTFKCADITNLRVVVDNDAVKTLNATAWTGSESKTGSLVATKSDGDRSEGGIYFNNVENGTVTGTINLDGELKEALGEGQTKTITWRFIYTLSDGNVNECVMAYTVAYAPLCTTSSTASATAGAGNTNKNASSYRFMAVTTAWITGIHGIVDSGSGDQTGSMIDPPLTDSTVTFLEHPKYGGSDKPLASGTGAAWFFKSDEDASNSGGTAYLNIDTSRFTYYNQIPYFLVGVDVNNGKAWTDSGTENIYSRYAFAAQKKSENAESIGGTEIYSVNGRNTIPDTMRKSVVPADKISVSNKYLTVGSKLYLKKNSGRNARAKAYCEFNYTDKQTLRDKLTEVMKEYIQDDWAFDSSLSNERTAYVNAIKNTYEVLGNPAATSTAISNAATTLTTAAKAYNSKLVTRSNERKVSNGDATATHYAFVKSVSANGVASETRDTVGRVYTDSTANTPFAAETKPYLGSDDVIIQSNSFTGYEYLGYVLTANDTDPGSARPSYALNSKTFERYSRIDETIQKEKRDKLTFYYEAPDANLSIDLDGGVYPVDKLNTEITATTGSVFAVQAPTRAGYTFKGWRLDGAGNLANGTYTFGLGDGKLTAQWEAIPTESTELIVDPAGGTMKENELLFIEHGAASASGDNGNGTLTYNITDSDDGRSLNISGHYKGFTYGEANATGERTQIIPVWVYLEDGKSYTISWNTDNDITEFFLFKNGDLKNRVSFSSGANHSFSKTFTAGAGWYYDSSLAESEKNATGWYQLRLDQNMPVAAEGQPANEGDYNITGLTIVANDGAKLGYKQAAETTVFISEPVRDGYKFAGWSGLVNGTMSRVDPDETNVNGGYLYTFKGKADTLVAQWVDAVYEIGFDNLFLATEWAEGKYTSASNDAVGFDKDNDIITYKNNKNADDKTDSEARRAESDYRITGLVPGREYVLSYDFASNYAGSAGDNDGNTYVFAHFYDENGKQINIKNSSINYGAQGEYVAKYVVNYTNPDGSTTVLLVPSEWAGSDTRMFSGLQTVEVLAKDGYGHSDIIFTAPEGTVSMDIAFGAQHIGQIASFKNVQISEYDRVNPVTDYSAVQKTYDKDTTVFGTLATAKKLGYDFKGWFTGKNGTGTQITAQTPTASYHKKFTVWSNWEKIQYTVTYDAAGGTLANGTVNPTKYTINTEKITAAAAPSKKGYTFKGWSVTKVNTAVHADNNWTEATVAAGNEFTGKLYGDVKLTAVWEENASNVVVVLREQNADGSYTETGIINGTKLDGDVIDLSAQVAAKTGFKAAVVTNNGSAFTLSNGKFTVAGGTSYNIIITRDRETYTFTVQYKMSDGTTAPAGVTKTLYYGQSASVTSPDKPGYTPDKKIATVNAISANTTVTVTYTLNTYNVTVHYVYEDGTKAADDKTVKVDYNKSYSVDSPSIVGFTADKLDVSGVMGIGDVEATVTYKINSHKLTIIYKYAENEKASTSAEYNLKYGTTYSYDVPEVEGFTASPAKVKGTMADGDITVTVTYTIKKFTVKFSDWNGTLLKSQEVKWGADAEAPANPAREGYTFTGWSGSYTNIKADTDIKALYTINTYTLSFNTNGGTAVSNITAAYAIPVTAPVTTRTGYTFVKWTGDDGSDFPSVMPAKNIEFTASWTANSYSIVFDANGGTGTTAPVNAVYDSEATLTANGFERVGYHFAGWNTAANGSGTSYADKAVVKNLASENGAVVKLYAVWEANAYTVIYKADGKEVGRQTYKFGETIKPITDPVKEGYTFKGWKESLPAVMPANDITVEAVFEINSYKLTYIVDGKEYKSYDVAFGAAVTPEAAPAKQGYTFAGWTPELPGTMPANDVTVTAKWTANSDTKVTIVFETENLDGTYSERSRIERNGITDTVYTVADADMTKLDGFTVNKENSVLSGTVKADGSLVLTVKYDRNTYTLTYEVDGTQYGEKQPHKFGSAVTMLEEPTKEGYTFSGWDKTLTEMPANDVTVKGTFGVNTYKLTYVIDGEEYRSYDIDYGTAITPEAAPTKEGYTFSGWSEIPGTMPANDVTVTAKWIANGDTKVTLIYEFEGLDGKYAEKNRVEKTGTTGTEYTVADADKITSDGFTLNENASVLSGTVKADGSLELVLRFDRNTYTLTYEVDGEQYGEKQTYKFGYEVAAPGKPEKTGYTFSGWDKTLTEMPAHDVTVKGSFTVNTYSVAFMSNGGMGEMAAESFRYDEEKALSGNEFTRTGYTFAGWSTTANGENGYNYTDREVVSKLCTANGAQYVLYAQWTANTYTVTFNKGADDATGTMADQTFTYDEAAALSENKFARTGYDFVGWTDGKNTYTDAQEVLNLASSGTVTLTAVWDAKGDTKVTIVCETENLDGTYSERSRIERNGITDTVYTVADADMTKLDGFTVNKEDSTLFGTVKADGSLVLTVRYDRNTYIVTYEVDGTQYGEKQTYKFGSAVTMLEEPTKEGYTFSGWSEIPGTMPANDVTVNGTFAANTYFVEFNANDGTGSMDKQSFVYDAAQRLTANAFTKDGFVFAGWNTASDGTGTAYDDKAEVINLTTGKVDVVLYAQWKKDANGNGIPDENETPWNVTYAASNGGSLNGNTSEKVLDGMKPVNVPAPQADTGYAFRFWTLVDGTKVVPADTVIKADTHFTAVFGVDANHNGTADEDEGKFTVTYDMNGSKVTELVLAGLAPAAVPGKDKANKTKPDGKCFAYWTLDGEKVDPSTVTVNGDITFTAVYAEDLNGNEIPDGDEAHYTVTYDKGAHGTLTGTTTITVVKDLAYSTSWEPAVTPDKGYMFKGWDNVPEKITEDVVITALYGEDKNGNGKEDGTEDDPFYTVTFVDWNGTELKTVSVLNGMSAAGEAPTGLTRNYDSENHYSFSGWDKDITDIQSSLTVTAQYTAEAHTYGEWKETTAPTCTEDGEKVRECECGASETAAVGALGHDWGEWTETKKATCTEKGEETRTCQRDKCGVTETRPTDLAKHTPGDAVNENIVPATCETDGSHDEVVKCSVCGTEISRVTVKDDATGHKAEVVPGKEATCTETGLTAGEKCSVCGKELKAQEVTPALGHDWGEWKETKKATCTEKGEETRICQRDKCGVTETRPTDLAKHTPGEAVKENIVPAACETDGSHEEVVKCSVCGTEISRTTVTDKAIGHKYGEWTVVTPATCTAEGLEQRVCANDASHVETRAIPVAKHTEKAVPGKEATCTEPGMTDAKVCEKCGKTLVEATEIPVLGHDWGDWKVTVAPTYTSTGTAMRECSRCGKTEEKELPAYDHTNDYLEIIAPDAIRAGTEVDIKAMRMPAETLEADAKWTSSDDSILTYFNGKFYAFAEGTVTLTAVTADGTLKAEKVITVLAIDYGNARIIKFQNMRKMDYTVAGFYKVYNDGAIYWSRTSECPFTVYTYSNFNYPDFIVYLDGIEVEADENGIYHIPAGTKNVVVSIAGATTDTDKPDDGSGSGSTGSKVSFWELIVRFFKKLFSIFKRK